MTPSDIKHFDLVLVGGGHANIQVLKSFAMKPIRGLRISLISDVAYAPYSGMLPGLLAGWYDFDQVHFDLRKLCQQSGARFVLSSVNNIDSKTRTLFFADRSPLQYDIASINIGIAPKPLSFDGEERENFFPLKPIKSLLGRWKGFLSELDSRRGDIAVAVIGGGAAGFEISNILARLLQRRKLDAKVSLLTRDSVLLKGHSPRAQRQALSLLQKNAVEVIFNQEVAGFDGQTLQLGEGSRPFDFVFCATDAAAPAWLKNSDLPLSEDGFIKTLDDLSVADRPDLFAAGDCIHFASSRLPKAGVYAVRQGPTLAKNLRRRLFRQKTCKYRPQKTALALLIAGDRRVLASKGAFSLSSEAFWRWKDHIDRKFMERFQSVASMSGRSSREAITRDGYIENTCGGCGAKVAPHLLAETLKKLKAQGRFLLSDDLGKDDCSVHAAPSKKFLTANLDAFRSFVDAPYVFGQVAVEHALNDIYAMAAQPTSAQLLVTLEKMHPMLAQRDFEALMSGVLSRLTAEGVTLSGGHTLEGDSLSIGISALGETDSPISKKISSENAVLIHTKKVGTGAILKAHMLGQARGAWVDEVLASMLVNQSKAAEIFANHGTTAMTDVTGFGLLGHLVEMIQDTGFSVKIDVGAVQSFDGFAFCSEDHETVLAHANREFCQPYLESNPLPKAFFDPQTSGGLLAAIPRENSDACLNELHLAGFENAQVIGRVLPKKRKGKGLF